MKKDFDTISCVEYDRLINESDHGLTIGDTTYIKEKPIKNAQTGFASGLILGISAGVAFILCIIVLYLMNIIKL